VTPATSPGGWGDLQPVRSCGPRRSSSTWPLVVGFPLTWLKLGLVLLVMLKRFVRLCRRERLARVVPGAVPRGLLRNAVVVAAVSQPGWWGAVIIGFANAQ